MTRTQPEKPEEERSDRTVRNPAGTRKREAAEHSRRKQIVGTAGSTKPAPGGQGELSKRFCKHRTGDGSCPYHTHYWEQDGPGLVIDSKSMPRTDFQKLQSLQTAGVIDLHDFGAWMSIIF